MKPNKRIYAKIGPVDLKLFVISYYLIVQKG